MRLSSSGFNVEETTLIGLETTTWDLGGRTPMRPLWRHYFQNMRGIIFVLDSSSDMLSWTKDELDRLLTEEGLAGLPLLLAINKMDLPNAKSATEIMETLNLNTLMTGSNPRSYKVVTLSATKDISGMVEGLEWLKKEMRTRVELSISPQTGNKTLSPNINKPMKAVSSSPKSVSDLKQQLSTDTMGQFPSTKNTATASASSSAVRAS